MSLETDKKLEQAGNAVDIRALADYEYDINKNDTDTIDFGSEIDASEVISFDSKTGETHGGSNESEQELAKKIQESTETGLKPVRHQESTLLVDSPLLELKEEMAGERVASDKSSHHYLVFFIGYKISAVECGILLTCLDFFGLSVGIRIAGQKIYILCVG